MLPFFMFEIDNAMPLNVQPVLHMYTAQCVPLVTSHQSHAYTFPLYFNSFETAYQQPKIRKCQQITFPLFMFFFCGWLFLAAVIVECTCKSPSPCTGCLLPPQTWPLGEVVPELVSGLFGLTWLDLAAARGELTREAKKQFDSIKLCWLVNSQWKLSTLLHAFTPRWHRCSYGLYILEFKFNFIHYFNIIFSGVGCYHRIGVVYWADSL